MHVDDIVCSVAADVSIGNVSVFVVDYLTHRTLFTITWQQLNNTLRKKRKK